MSDEGGQSESGAEELDEAIRNQYRTDSIYVKNLNHQQQS